MKKHILLWIAAALYCLACSSCSKRFVTRESNPMVHANFKLINLRERLASGKIDSAKYKRLIDKDRNGLIKYFGYSPY